MPHPAEPRASGRDHWGCWLNGIVHWWLRWCFASAEPPSEPPSGGPSAGGLAEPPAVGTGALNPRRGCRALAVRRISWQLHD